ncbi:actin filament organization protein app1-like protein [Diplodia corticola]|uniref:Actin filament organization protein app1-like protein n=1 Tax=Diplodia corticola TaxID=236234 RepID=A0A1J9RDY9_9PEZI|nr:actin filament organization protein app1-like protein [Diplodia corticola]OJD30771.1 actin filament organization protein app1-like protein [Diplodia corticola]
MAVEYARDAFWQTLGYIAQETESDRELRTAGRFADFEKTMPHLPLSRLRDISVVDNVSSYLGKRNPLARPVDPDKHVVWLQDNTAYRPNGTKDVWEAEFVCAYFVKNSGRDWGRVVADIADKAGLGAGNKHAEATIAKRLEPWMDSILPAHTVKIRIGDNNDDDGDESQIATLGPSDRSGVSKTLIRTPDRHRHADGDTITSHSINHLATRHMTTTFAEPTGWAVISDIDDTIKITQTPSPAGILRSTFVDDPQPVAGMPALYAHIRASLGGNPPFWYLSASPYNLYPFLRDFRARFGFPDGPLLLRNASWMDLAGFLVALTAGTKAYKTDRMRDLQRMFPRRRFVLVGDSTQSDPEAYGEMARLFPEWVGKVLIRRVTGVAEIDRTSKNTVERFERAFEGVERGVWTVFDRPEEVYGEVERLVGRK